MAKPLSPVKSAFLNRIPVRTGNSLVLVPIARITMIVADREKLIISTLDGDRTNTASLLTTLGTTEGSGSTARPICCRQG